MHTKTIQAIVWSGIFAGFALATLFLVNSGDKALPSAGDEEIFLGAC